MREEQGTLRAGLGTIGMALLFAAGAFGGVLAVAFKWRLAQTYPDLVVGNITWKSLNKSFDYLAVLGFVTTFGLTILLARLANRRLEPNAPGSHGSATALDRTFLYCLIPAAIWIGGWLASGPLAINQANLSLKVILSPFLLPILSAGAGGLVLIAALGLSRYHRPRAADNDAETVLPAILLAAFLALMAGLALMTMAGRSSVALRTVMLATAKTWRAMADPKGLIPLCLAVTAGLLFWLFSSPDVTAVKRRLAGFLLLVQVPLPFFWFGLLPAPVRIDAVYHDVHHPTIWLYGLLGIIIISSLLALLRKWRAWQQGPDTFPLERIVTAGSLAAILVFIRIPVLGLNYYSGDDYHYSEQFLPWQQFSTFGKLPFVDLNYPRGLFNLLLGAINEAFFDGTAASFPAAGVVVLALSISLTLLALRLYLPPLPSLFLALVASSTFYHHFNIPHYWLALAPFLFMLWPGLRARPYLWLATWGGMGYLLTLYIPSTGSAFVLATMPLAAWTVFLALRENVRRFLMVFCISCLAAAAVMLLTPMGPITLGLVRFLAENSAVNTVAYGIGWVQSLGVKPAPQGIFSSWLFFEMLRIGWVGIFLFLVSLAGMAFRQPVDTPGRSELGASATAFALFPLALLSYSFGRIDPEGISRTGMLSLWMAGCLLPFLACRMVAPSRWPALFLGLAVLTGICSRLTGAQIEDGMKLLQAPFREITPSIAEQSQLAKNAAFPRLGYMVLPAKNLEGLEGLRQELAELLRPGETYLDLTNRAARYFFLGLPVPALEAAIFNAPATKTQARMLKQIDQAPPPVVLVWGDTILHDGGTVALRANLLYRKFALSYVPIKRGGFIFLIRPDRADGLPVLQAKETAPLADEEIKNRLLATAFRQEDLKKIPVAWGRSLATLTPLLLSTAKLPGQWQSESAAGKAAFVRLPVDAVSLDGSISALVKMDFQCIPPPKNASVPLTLSWSSVNSVDKETYHAIRLNAENGTLLIPLDSNPYWLTVRNPTAFTVRLADPGMCREVIVRDVEFFGRNR